MHLFLQDLKLKQLNYSCPSEHYQVFQKVSENIQSLCFSILSLVAIDEVNITSFEIFGCFRCLLKMQVYYLSVKSRFLILKGG